MTDRSCEVSEALTEVRTVLSRAESAMDRLIYLSYRGNERHDKAELRTFSSGLEQWMPTGELKDAPGETPDPDTEDMYLALDRVVHELDRWRKAGKRKKR